MNADLVYNVSMQTIIPLQSIVHKVLPGVKSQTA